MKDDDGLFLKRSNYLEETYFSWSIVSVMISAFAYAIVACAL
jgi:hypothetical protein